MSSTQAALATPARAAGFVYRYASNDFTRILQGSCLKRGSRATMTMIFAKPIPANCSGAVKPRSWQASGGVNTYTNAAIGSISGGAPQTNLGHLEKYPSPTRVQ